MTCLEQKTIFELPDEILEEIMTYLLFYDFLNVSKVEKRLENCANRVMKKQPFSKYII